MERGAVLRLRVATHPRLLCTIRAAIRALLQDIGLGEDRISEIVLAVDEACSNAMRHAYGGRTDGWLELAVRTPPQYLEIEVRDGGRPAHPDRLQRRELAPPDPAEVQPGGLGVQLMYRVFDEVRFRPGRLKGNRVTMRLCLPHPTGLEPDQGLGRG